MQCRNVLYEKNVFAVFESPVPVISVGNISLGGTGKTPLAEYIISHYLSQNHTPAYLSRGYGRKSKGYKWVKPHEGGAQLFGDEALQVAMKFPDVVVAVCEDRSEGIRNILKEHSVDVIILDDAFQHRSVNRLLDIMVIDANRLPNHDFVLPVGRLRESHRNIKRADIIVVNKLTDVDQIDTITSQISKWQKPLAFTTPVAEPIVSFKTGEPELHSPTDHVILFSGLGNNSFFLKQVSQQGWKVVDYLFFQDHHPYSVFDMQKITTCFNTHFPAYGDALCILTTEKDYARIKSSSWLSSFSELPLYYLPIKLEWWKGESDFVRCLEDILRD